MAVRTMYSTTRARVVTADGTTDKFKIFTGLLQGDTLAPFLFIVVLEYALRTAVDRREIELRGLREHESCLS